MITCSAPAKVIISGEHAVVYGKPGLVTAVNLRLKFSVWERDKKITKKSIINIEAIVKKYLTLKKIKYQNKKFDFKIDSDIPIGSGLGSSAALVVCATAALLKFYSGREFSKEIVSSLAYQAEKFFHKNPSGVDVSASCFGGLVFYRKEFEFLKNISSLNFKIPKEMEDNLYLIDSGRALESTANMVFGVGKLYNRRPKFIEEILGRIEKTTKRITASIIKKDENFFVKNILENEIYLELLGVVSKNTKGLLNNLSPYGVGKVTGAGGKTIGSGFILFYCKENKGLKGFLKQKRLTYYKFKQDYQGLIYEN